MAPVLMPSFPDLCFAPGVPMPAIDWRLFAPFSRLVRVTIGRVVYRLPERNSLLRGLQFLDPNCLDYGSFCWNGDCHTCIVRIVAADGSEETVLACSTDARDGMHLAGPPAGVHLPNPDAVVIYDDLDADGQVRPRGGRDRP